MARRRSSSLRFFAADTGRWVEEARVEHCIQDKQMTTEFLRWYFRGQGASIARSRRIPARRCCGEGHDGSGERPCRRS